MNWTVIEEQELVLEEEFEHDLYQDRNYVTFTFPDTMDEHEVYIELLKIGAIS